MKPPTMRRQYRCEAVAALIAARLAVRFLSTRRVLAWASRAPARTNRFIGYEAGWIRWAVDDIGPRWWIRANCLPRALAAQWMLRRRGIASRLCLGVAREENALSAHAWIELGQDIVVGGAEMPRFTRLVEFGGERA